MEDDGVVAGEQAAAFGVEDVVGSEAFFKRFAEGDHVFGIAGGPGAEEVALVVGHGADEGYGFELAGEGEEGAGGFNGLVFEQDDGFVGYFAGQSAFFGGGLVGGAWVRVGVVEEAEEEFDPQDAAGGFLDDRRSGFFGACLAPRTGGP